MGDTFKSYDITVRGMITNYMGKIVSIEDDVQYASFFQIQAPGVSVETKDMDAAIDKIMSIFENDGSLRNLKGDEDYKHKIRTRFDYHSPNLIVEYVVKKVAEKI
jgi:hypothetical protein